MNTLEVLLAEREIHKLIIDLGRCLDTGNFKRHGENFHLLGILELPFITVQGNDEITRHSSENLGNFAQVYHTITDVVIDLNESLTAATARANVHALHLFNVNNTSDFAEIGGYYLFDISKNSSGIWKFSKVKLVKVWSSGSAPNIGVIQQKQAL